ncbi:SoxS protein [Paracoccus marinaquae]|uniref:SoxS protein n=1 Tax=Paracoccus marinaquae TaxID=2841926 RepID=A0ABS6AGR7_9RHOB|nr:SoxS protein [Paracoccus marinaquae]MBU3028566.1 SoxS protein [Paracoccus marinaquae]
MPSAVPRRSVLLTGAAALAGGLAAFGPGPVLAIEASHIAPDRIDWRVAPMRLLMVEARDCDESAAWRRQIGGGYAASPVGRAAPLLLVDFGGPWPDGIVLGRRPNVTPTFVLLRRGMELDRIEGYPGEQFFYPRVAAMLRKAGTGVEGGRSGG